MIPPFPTADSIKLQLSEALKVHTTNARIIRVRKNQNVYTSGDENRNVYFIESGHIKLLMLSPSGKECLLAIYTAGDVFGELCLFHPGEHPETATAMNNALVKRIPPSRFFLYLSSGLLGETLIKYLAVRISELYETINDFVTIDSEQRLGHALLNLARRTGMRSPRGIRFNYKITHEELSAMIGTTRPRVSKFMRRFRELGLIGLSADRFIVVREKDLSDYLDRLN
jgi:CRP-like cAMP-binding protein